MITPWIQCHECGDYICQVHFMHVADCDCPVIDVWAEHDLYPYEPNDKDKVTAFIAAHPI